jgi:transposase-like protein
MQSGTFEKLSGKVEVDETYIGGLARNMHRDRRAKNITGTGGTGKAAVMGLLERNGKVRAKVIADATSETLHAEVRGHVEAGAELFTDGHKGYSGLRADYIHQVIDHAEKYVDGQIHTNGIENFWSLLKRGIKGTYVSVEPFHLFRYLDEQSFRFNTRKGNDADRFIETVKSVTGKRLTFDELTGKGLSSH